VSVIRQVCFDFVHEAIEPYSIERLRYIEEYCAAIDRVRLEDALEIRSKSFGSIVFTADPAAC